MTSMCSLCIIDHKVLHIVNCFSTLPIFYYYVWLFSTITYHVCDIFCISMYHGDQVSWLSVVELFVHFIVCYVTQLVSVDVF